jgi:hypothetical protein
VDSSAPPDRWNSVSDQGPARGRRASPCRNERKSCAREFLSGCAAERARRTGMQRIRTARVMHPSLAQRSEQPVIVCNSRMAMILRLFANEL